MTLRIGIIGAGRSGMQQAGILNAYPDVQITSVAEPSRPSRDSLSRAFSTQLAVIDHRRLAADPCVDVVYICTPPATHSTIAIDCLQAGKHVICKSPMAVTVDQADEMLDAAKEAGKRLLIALPQRYDPLNQKAARMIEEEEIGYPFMAISSCIDNEYERLNDWDDWKGTWDLGGGGILMERGPEMVDLLHYYFGHIEAVSAVCTRFAIDALNKAEDSCLIDLEFVEELSAQLALTGAAQFSASHESYSGKTFTVEVFGVDGSMKISNAEQHIVLSTTRQRHQIIPLSDIHTGLPCDMNRDLLDCILEDREPLSTAADAREALVVVVAAYKSSQMKRRVETLEEL